eukprot:Gb_08932 [translate_table: standard]
MARGTPQDSLLQHLGSRVWQGNTHISMDTFLVAGQPREAKWMSMNHRVNETNLFAGRTFLLWFGPTARINVTDPELVKEIFYTKFEDYEKAEAHSLVKKLEGDGLLSLSGDKWAHHRRIINPTFHMENLNGLIPVIADSIASMLERWRKNIELGANEIEVSGDFQNLSVDIIARATFGTSYEEGKHLFNMQASSSAMDFSHDILPWVLSFYHHWTKIYGRTFVLWFGPTARINVTDPELVKEIFYTKFEDYEKAEAHPLVKKLEGDGLLSLSGDKWAHHRRIINPSFHMENLNVMIIFQYYTNSASMLERWRKNIELSANEIEVSGDFQNLSADIIARAAFGSSYEEGKHLFNMQGEQMIFAAEAFHKIILPSCR